MANPPILERTECEYDHHFFERDHPAFAALLAGQRMQLMECPFPAYRHEASELAYDLPDVKTKSFLLLPSGMYWLKRAGRIEDGSFKQGNSWETKTDHAEGQLLDALQRPLLYAEHTHTRCTNIETEEMGSSHFSHGFISVYADDALVRKIADAFKQPLPPIDWSLSCPWASSG